MAADVSQDAGAGVSEPGPPLPGRKGWTVGRIVALVAGSVLILMSVVLLCGAGVLMWAEQQQRGGYLTTGTATYSTGGYALASDPVSVHGRWGWLGWFVGEVQIRVTSARGASVFVAVGPAGDVSRYLAGVRHVSVSALGDHDVAQHPGSAVLVPPATALDWAVQAQGTGIQTLRWTARTGDWMVLVMNPDGSPGLTVRVEEGITSPMLPAFAGQLLAMGIGAGLIGTALAVVASRMAAGGR